LYQADSLRPAEEQRHDLPSGTSRFRPDIEGLRAVAVLAVVLFHAEVPGVRGGYVGVDVFFVISGFLITGMLWREAKATGSVRLRRFYGARARRLLPASAFVGVVTMVAVAVLLPVLQARPVLVDGIASALYVSNYRFILQGVDYLALTAPPSPFQHYWSLGVEEQFYLVWPALILAAAWLIRRRRTQATASYRPYLVVLASVAVVSFALSLATTYALPPVAFFSLPTRAWQLAMGGLIALTSGHWSRLRPRIAAVIGWVGLATILLACVELGPTTPYPGTAALLPTVGAMLVIGAGCAAPSQGCGRVLRLRPMQAIGRISYSWYLWHWPVLLVALWSVAPLVGHARWLAAGGILLSAGLAVLTLRFIENPLRFAPKIRNSAWRSIALGGAATAVAVCVGLGLLLVIPNPVGHGSAAAPMAVTSTPVPDGSGVDAYNAAVQVAFNQVQAAVAASVDLGAVPSNLQPPLADAQPRGSLTVADHCFRGIYEVGQPECASGDTTSGTTVALVGDSNAAMWGPSFQRVADQQRWRLETMTKAACPLLDLPIANPTSGQAYTECEQWRSQIIARLNAEHPRLIVLSVMRRYGASYGWAVGFTSYDQAWIESLNRLVQQLRGTGAKLLVLGPIPDPHSTVTDCLAKHLDDAAACAAPRSLAVNQSGIAAEAAATKVGGGGYVDLSDLFCAIDRCPVIVGNTLVYSDENHVTPEYSRALAPAMGALADRALAQR
jgi:peptidoglycan/LPS O-acetylase OafA/YrhL